MWLSRIVLNNSKAPQARLRLDRASRNRPRTALRRRHPRAGLTARPMVQIPRRCDMESQSTHWISAQHSADVAIARLHRHSGESDKSAAQWLAVGSASKADWQVVQPRFDRRIGSPQPGPVYARQPLGCESARSTTAQTGQARDRSLQGSCVQQHV